MKFLLIGKPNVGKSSIYNILIGNNENIIHKEAGTTRDWHYSLLKNSNNIFIFDTPGILIEKNDYKKIINIEILNIIKNKIDIFLYVVDYKDIDNIVDHNAILKLQKYNKEIILLINKFDNYKINPTTEIELYKIKKKFLISCAHKYSFKYIVRL